MITDKVSLKGFRAAFLHLFLLSQVSLARSPFFLPEDIGSLAQKFKKSYIDEKYGVEEAEKKYAEWDKLMQQLFIRRK